MKTAPKWLKVFPFIETQWECIVQLLDRYPEIDVYDINNDWDHFVRANQQSDQFALLRQFRKSRLAFLAYVDFQLPLSEHIKTMHRVTVLAEHLISQAYLMAVSDMQQRFGKVLDAQKNVVDLQIFALGKLGTQELNYSSDVDLVFVYPEYGESNGKRTLDAESYFTRLGQKIIKLLDYFSPDGLVYRVDMRLRPFGSAGSLVCSEKSLVQYLVNEGRDWERFAWMRARLICGNSASAQSLLSELKSFIYRKHLDYQVFSSLAKIKKNIASVYPSNTRNLKHGLGGIRTIEFIIQSLQLVFGGRDAKLQGVSIYPMFEHLVNEKKMPVGDGELLKSTWVWLRKLENMSQIINDESIHELPENEEAQIAFATINNHASWESLEAMMGAQRGAVDDLFIQLFNDSNQDESLTQADEQLMQQLLDQINFQRVPKDTVQKAKKLLELTVVKAAPEVCHDFVQIIKVLLKRPSYLLMLLREHNVHNNVLKLLAAHTYFKKVLLDYPVLFEQLFEHQPFEPLNHDKLSGMWSARQLGAQTLDDVENWMEQLRYFKLVNQFNLMRSISVGEITPKQLGVQLTLLAEFIIFKVCDQCWNELHTKHSDVKIVAEDLMVLAYGSMAVYDMSITSDLDLVFIIDQPNYDAEERVFVHKWVKRILHHLGSQMYHGLLYEIDLQLRPNGRSGSLVTTKSEFEKYQRTQAWTWEHAAMVKSRLVSGCDAQKQWHQILRQNVLIQKRDPLKVSSDLKEMSGKLQLLKGDGAHHKDFAVLAAVLIHAHQYPELVMIDDMQELNNRLGELGLLEP
ncbi:hypothetical protein [Marinicella litoralis]|uniref:Glutamate-ammonia-ligase adenylyltransferase n=1 Tax=Marinicella litoralis TaxID=644220 RepID=A0A4R6XWG6_9GAMM|nr:hypothetical protein [Marinicella litoralis]TDR20838.1 glutamate-ammonia-ligase adenylyltransferase [Marinicella litoralis]